MAIDLNKLFNYYINQGISPQTAAQYVVFEAISNPTGNLASIKRPPKWYTEQEWIDFNAPDYNAILKYSGTDPLSTATRDFFKQKGSNIKLSDVQEFANTAANLTGFSKTALSTQDFYNQLKDVYNQFAAAKKDYKTQKDTHVYAQYGLPDPTLKFVVDPNKVVQGQTVLYEPAQTYIKQKGTAFYNNIRKQGLSQAAAQNLLGQYTRQMQTALQKKLDESPVTPFTQKGIELAKTKVPKKQG